jgi:DNA-binding FadR family transcriptional regulator
MLATVAEFVPTRRPAPAPPEDGTLRGLPSLAVRPARLSVVVVTDLVDGIVSGDYPSGGLLPPEPALCQSFGVSRSVVREALKVLQEKGLVTVHQGQGTVVTYPEEWNLLDPVILASLVRQHGPRDVLDDLLVVRAALEAGMAARAACVRTDEDLARLHVLREGLAGAMEDARRYIALDMQFHDELMRISRNRLARAVVDAIHRQARSSPGYTDADAEDIRLTQRGHLAILEQIEVGDQKGAATAMREHIMTMWRRKRDRSAHLRARAT